MIKVISYTHEPLSLMGEVASFCWNSKPSKEIAIKCIKSNHGRVLEFPDVLISIEGYSARMVRELFRHVIGTTFLQESTRYVNCKNFDYYTPNSIKQNEDAYNAYADIMENISDFYECLENQKISKEDIANILPLGMMTKVVYKINLRALSHLFELRTCTRAYVEFRDFMEELRVVLSSLDDDWKYIIDNFAKTKCEITKSCIEDKSCGRWGMDK
jgi:thymidylate synthase (FAD)